MKGSIYKRGKKYAISFSCGFDQSGNRIRINRGGYPTKTDAEKALFELNQQFYQGEQVINENMILSDYLDYWFKNYVCKELAPNTIAGYKTNIYNHVIPAIGHLKVMEIRPIHIMEFYSQMQRKGLSNSTILYIHRNLHAAFSYADMMQIFTNRVMERVKPPKNIKYNATILSGDQCIVLMEAAKNTEIYIPIVLAISLGLRRGEILGLQWHDFDPQHKMLHIARSVGYLNGELRFSTLKTQSSDRVLLLSDDIVEILKEEYSRQNHFKSLYGKEYNPNNLICCRLSGDWITTNYLTKRFKKILEECGLPNIRLHDLRHSNATLLAESGMPPTAIAARLGHSSTKVTINTYTHVTMSMQISCANVVEERLFKKSLS
ncbi:MAG: site-specific integrase [Dialister sp.]|uniref:tyrosine-type recombinase/integrase n=1 Tax=Dialister sp. TaxID=1955814 RepID=UPI001E0DAA00|nr:site-specific integrase [Dialister sp.]MBS6715342.1 site-specific integrase [Dialister sp.]